MKEGEWCDSWRMHALFSFILLYMNSDCLYFYYFSVTYVTTLLNC